MKKLFTAIILVCLVFTMTACANTNEKKANEETSNKTSETKTEAETKADEKTESIVLRFWQAGADTANATNVMNELLVRFMKENPNIIIEYQAVPWASDPHVQFQTAIASRDVADLLVVGNPFDFVLAGENSIQALDDYLDDTVKGDLMGFANECIYYGDNTELNGKYTSIPLYGDARTILFNKEIFDAVGAPYPTESISLDEFQDLARKVTGEINGTHVYGFATSAKYASQYLPFIWDMGGDILNSTLDTATINNDFWKAGVEYYKTFFTEGITPKGSEAMDLADQLAMFLNGEIAMMIATSDYATEISNTEEWADKLGVGAVPHDEKQYAFAGADTLVMPSSTEHPEETAKLINFLLQPDNQLTYVKAVGFTPVSKTAAQDSYFTSSDLKAGFSEAVNCGKFYVKSPISSGVTTTLRTNIQLFLSDDITIDDFLKDTDDQINALFTE